MCFVDRDNLKSGSIKTTLPQNRSVGSLCTQINRAPSDFSETFSHWLHVDHFDWDGLVKKGHAEEGRNASKVTFNTNSQNTKANDFLIDMYEHCGRLSVAPREVKIEANVF